METELKPCPFCGARRGYAAPPALGKGRWVIQCDDCRSEGPTSSDNSDDGEAEAIAAWNTRADGVKLDAAEARVKVLEGGIEEIQDLSAIGSDAHVLAIQLLKGDA